MEKLIPYRLTRDAHPYLIEQVRLLFNVLLPHLATHPLCANTAEEQQEWWKNLDHSSVVLHLYSPIETPWLFCAFSMVTDRGSYFTPMFGIDEKWWGKGYGEEIIHHYLLLASGKPLHGEQLVSNGAICHLNERLGWKVLSEKDGTQFLLHLNNTSWPQSAYDEIVRYSEEGV